MSESSYAVDVNDVSPSRRRHGTNEGWVQVRVKTETYQRLCQYRNSLQRWSRRLPPQVPGHKLSCSDAIAFLLFDFDNHQARSRASKKRARRTK
jgi:hypothetical protein